MSSSMPLSPALILSLLTFHSCTALNIFGSVFIVVTVFGSSQEKLAFTLSIVVEASVAVLPTVLPASVALATDSGAKFLDSQLFWYLAVGSTHVNLSFTKLLAKSLAVTSNQFTLEVVFLTSASIARVAFGIHFAICFAPLTACAHPFMLNAVSTGFSNAKFQTSTATFSAASFKPPNQVLLSLL